MYSEGLAIGLILQGDGVSNGEGLLPRELPRLVLYLRRLPAPTRTPWDTLALRNKPVDSLEPHIYIDP